MLLWGALLFFGLSGSTTSALEAVSGSILRGIQSNSKILEKPIRRGG